MAAVITLKLRDQATPGLEDFQRVLQETGAVGVQSADDLDRLTDAQARQIKVVHEHRGSMLQFSGTVLYAGATAFSAYSQLAALGRGTGMLGSVMANTSKIGGGVAAVFGSIATKGRALLIPLGLIGGTLGVVAVAGAAVTAGLTLLGKSALTLNETFKQSEKATDAQKKKFQELQREAKELGVSIETAAQRAGVALDDLGVKVDSNYARISKAGEELVGSLWNQTRDLTMAYADVAAQAVGIDRAYKGVTSTIDRVSDGIVSGLTRAREILDEIADAKFGEGYSKLARIQAEWNKNNAATAENFRRLREANDQLAKSSENADRSRKIAALTSIEAVEAEMQKTRAKFGEMAAARKFDAEAQKEYLDTFTALERRKTQIVDEQAREQTRIAAEAARERERLQREGWERYQEYAGERVRAVLDLQMTRQRNQAAEQLADIQTNSRARLATLSLEESRLMAVAATQERQEIVREQMLRQRQQIEADTDRKLHEARKTELTRDAKDRLEAVRKETDARLELAKTQEEKDKILHDDRMERQRIAFQTATDLATQETNHRIQEAQREAAAKIAIEDAQERIRRARIDAARQALDKQGMGGAAHMGAQKPADVVKALQDRRRKAALEEFDQSDRAKALEEEAKTSPLAARRLAAERRKIEKQAGIDAFQDARRAATGTQRRDRRTGELDKGELQPGEWQAAQVDAANKQIDALAKVGKVGETMIDSLRENVQAAGTIAQATAEQQAAIEALQGQIESIQKQVGGVARAASNSRQRAQRGSLGQ